MSYHVDIRIPKTYIDDGLVVVINKYFQEAYTKETLIEENTEQGYPNILYLEQDESRSGRMDEIENYCVTNDIPYDMHCSGSYDYDPEKIYFRPGMNNVKNVVVSMDNYEFIPARMILELADDFHALSKADIKKRLDGFINDFTAQGIEELELFTAETELGKNKDAMSRIDGVLAKVDSGELDIKEAMDEIKVIQEQAKKIYLVAVQEPYVDGCAIISSPSGEFGGEGHIDFKDSKQLILGKWHANSQQEAINLAADYHNVSNKILTAYQLS